MAENRCSCSQGSASSGARETVCIDTMRVLDSCRDRDCYEDIKVYLTSNGKEIIDHTATVRTTDAKIIGSAITVDAVPFNSGFYQINVRFYIRLNNEACVCPGTTRCFSALAILDKSVVLYGGEGSTTVFRSCGAGGFCNSFVLGEGCDNAPTAVVESVSPIILASRVVCCENGCGCACNCGCGCGCGNGCGCGHSCDSHAHACGCDAGETIPCEIAAQFPEGLLGAQDMGGNRLLVSLGIFSVVRLERPTQILVSASEYVVPDKECISATSEENPCCLFRSMAFPTDAFGTCHGSAYGNAHGKH